MIARLGELTSFPKQIEHDADAREWLLSQPWPSGWHDTIDQARAAVRQLADESEMTGAEVVAARKELGLSRAQFGACIGYKGNSNTAHKQVWEMEKGIKPVTPARARAIRAAVAGRILGGDAGTKSAQTI